MYQCILIVILIILTVINHLYIYSDESCGIAYRKYRDCCLGHIFSEHIVEDFL